MCVYYYDEGDKQQVLLAIQEGRTSRGADNSQPTGSEMEGSEFQTPQADVGSAVQSGVNLSKHLQFICKYTFSEQIIVAKLTRWKIKYKTTASEGSAPAQGRVDPNSKLPLFTWADRKSVV